MQLIDEDGAEVQRFQVVFSSKSGDFVHRCMISTACVVGNVKAMISQCSNAKVLAAQIELLLNKTTVLEDDTATIGSFGVQRGDTISFYKKNPSSTNDEIECDRFPNGFHQ